MLVRLLKAEGEAGEDLVDALIAGVSGQIPALLVLRGINKSFHAAVERNGGGAFHAWLAAKRAMIRHERTAWIMGGIDLELSGKEGFGPHRGALKASLVRNQTNWSTATDLLLDPFVRGLLRKQVEDSPASTDAISCILSLSTLNTKHGYIRDIKAVLPPHTPVAIAVSLYRLLCAQSQEEVQRWRREPFAWRARALRAKLARLVARETPAHIKQRAAAYAAHHPASLGAPRFNSAVHIEQDDGLPKVREWPLGMEAPLLCRWWERRLTEITLTMQWTVRTADSGHFTDWGSVGDGEWASVEGYVLGRSGLEPFAHAVVMLYSDARSDQPLFQSACERLLAAIANNTTAAAVHSPPASPSLLCASAETEEEGAELPVMHAMLLTRAVERLGAHSHGVLAAVPTH